MAWEPMSQKEFDELAITLKEAMRDGNAEAAMHVGNLYYNGPNGDAEDLKTAVPYWARAVDGGEYSCLHKVVHAYLYGPADVRNAHEGFRYCKLSADRGDVNAQFTLAECYLKGVGCVSSRENAKAIYRKLALNGNGKAQFRLYELLREDRDGEWDHWLHCAYISGVKEAVPILNSLIKNKEDKEIFEETIAKIKRNGWEPQKGGCYVATCVYGAYDCPQVWTLRRFRDNILASTWYGRTFVRVYYAVSPMLVKWFGHTTWFKNMWRGKLDVMVRKLQAKGVEATPYDDKIW